MQVEPNFLDKQDCPCGDERCTKYGVLGGRIGHVRGCCCIRCRNKRNTRKGDDKARKARKALNIQGVNSRHEELLGGALRVEFKAGKIILPAWTAYLRCEQQSEQARPIGDPRPFAAVFMPDGISDGVVVFRLSKATEVAVAILENFGGAA